MMLAGSLHESLNAWHPVGDGRQTHSHTQGAWTVTITADRADSVGCAIWELTVSRVVVGEAKRPVRDWAERIAKRASGLLESLRVHEVDDQRNEAILRSQSPSKKGSKAQYYEIHLSGNEVATMKRFAADTNAGTRREQIAFSLTNEVIGKLSEDLIAE